MAKPEKKPVKKEATSSAATVKKVVSKTGKEIRGIVRISGRDLNGTLPLERALTRVKGVGERLAVIATGIIAKELNVPQDIYVGELSEEQIDRVEEILNHPVKYGVPSWMLNRRKDIEGGLDKHLIGTDLTFTVRQDIEMEKNINTWIGYRHNYGQKVRGQHTRTTGRKGMTVGVLRKAVIAKQGAAAAPAAPAAGGQAAAAPAKKEEKK